MILHFADMRFQNLFMNRFLTSTFLFFLLVVFSAEVIRAEEIQNTDHTRWLHGFRIGILAHDVPLWSRTRSEGGFDLNAEVIFDFPDISFFTGKIHSNLGFSLNSQGDTNTLYSGLLWECARRSGLFFNFGLGLALHDGELQPGYDDKKALGSRVLFRIPVELGLRFAKNHGVSVLFVHVSNAYLADPNEGLDALGLRYTYWF